jgi:hypothetical protein
MDGLKKILNRTDFWIYLFFFIRLIGIINPPLEIGHNWRQTTGLMVARNFYEIDANILYPRVDDNEGLTGIIGMEFPALNYLHFLISTIFGYSHWYGRLINLIITSIGLICFSKIIKRYFNNRISFASTLILTSSIWFSFSRKMMPDTFCISLVFIGLFYGIKYLDEGKVFDILKYVFFTSLALLSKIPAGIYLVVLIPLMFDNQNKRRVFNLIIITIIPLVLTFIWYFIWDPYLSIKFGTWYNIGKKFPVGFNEILSHFSLVLKRFYFSSFYSYIFFVFFVVGIFFMIKNNYKKLLYPFILVSLIFIIYIIKSGFYFYHHNYYIIPYVPVMAVVSGYAISLIKKQWIFFLILFLGIIEGIANQVNDFFIKDSEQYKLELETIADSISLKNDLIAINGGGNPQQIYLTHRKGWTINSSQLTDSSFFKKIIDKGCKYIFVNKHLFKKKINMNIVFENKDYVVYELNTKIDK